MHPDKTKNNNFKNSAQDIAIIGISGRFPQSSDKWELWQLLKEGRDCVTEIPKERWDYQKYYVGQKDVKGKSYSKWGGFIADHDKFDPLFFNISPYDAEYLDPQARLFLESAWSVIEDAGYTPEKLVKGNEKENPVGVFSGVMWNDYQLFGISGQKDSFSTPQSTFWSIPNRVSHFFNFSGPSFAVDTACSSSLMAVHLACESLKKGECKTAIAGAVNLILHPYKYVLLSKLYYLSTDGKCRSFGKGGDGYVPAEGIVTILLKPLETAIADNDYIYGIIKGSAINHGGKTSGYTVPNPKAQAQLVNKVLDQTGINPSFINYFEAHGTGTSIGDPIEVAGLKEAFGSTGKQYCALGSVKSNIGHLESASGLAGLTKVIMQIKYKKLVPSIHSEDLNPNINFENSPFYIQRKYEDWKKITDKKKTYPRRAGINAFGAGGSNAHILIEEYEEKRRARKKASEPRLVILSAKSEDNLKAYSKKILKFIRNHQPDISFADLTYTLQVGRVEMEHRLAVMVSDIKELEQVLTDYCKNQKIDKSKILVDNVCNKNKFLNLFENNEKSKALINKWLKKNDLFRLANLWIQGGEINWQILAQNKNCRRIPLPSYAFTKEKYWLQADKEKAFDQQVAILPKLHPLIDKNISTFDRFAFEKNICQNEKILEGHVIGVKKVFPAAAVIEMVRAAAEMLNQNHKVKILKRISWALPLVAENQSKKVELEFIKKQQDIKFEISTKENQDNTIVYCQGMVDCQPPTKKEKKVDLKKIKARLKTKKDIAIIYQQFKKMGLNYGTAFQTIKDVYTNEKEVLVYLRTDSNIDEEQMKIDPYLLDGAFQSLICFNLPNQNKLVLPYYLEDIIIKNSLCYECYVHIKRPQSKKSTKYQINIYDINGNEIINIKDLKNFEADLSIFGNIFSYYQDNKSFEDTFLYKPKWTEAKLKHFKSSKLDTVIIFDKDEKISQQFLLKAKRVFLVKPKKKYQEIKNNIFNVNPQKKEDYFTLIESLVKKKVTSFKLIYLWDFDKNPISDDPYQYFEMGIYSLLYLTQALVKHANNKQVKILYLYQESNSIANLCHNAAAGFSKTLLTEYQNISCHLVQLPNQISTKKLIEISIKEFQSISSKEIEIKYENNKRLIKKLIETEPDNYEKEKSAPFKNKGVYVITGGVGGLGFIFAKYLLNKYQARVILIGRSELSGEKKQRLEELNIFAGEVSYFRADVTKFEEVNKVINVIKTKYRNINGIIHAAGVVKDSFIPTKTKTSFNKVIAPKILGTLNLDKALNKEKLDFFIMFSSISSELGNAGQSDYAYANSFMDRYAHFRTRLVNCSKRSGKTISINWPLWQEGGMQVDERWLGWARKRRGFTSLSTEAGLKCFEEIQSLDLPQVIVFYGDKIKVERLFEGKRSRNDFKKYSVLSEDKLHIIVEQDLRKIMADVLKMKKEEIDSKKDLSEYGMDSILIVKVVQELESLYDDTILPGTLAEYRTVKALANYLIKNEIIVKEEVYAKTT